MFSIYAAWSLFCTFTLLSKNVYGSYNATINISYDNVLWENPIDTFLSYTMDIANFYTTTGGYVDFDNENLQYLASKLNPAMLRVGGGKEDYTYYFDDPLTGECNNLPSSSTTLKTKTYFCFSKTNLTNLISFVDKVNVKLIFGLGIGYPYYPTNLTMNWNSSNVEQFLQYIVKNNLSKYFYGFELGNEINKAIQPIFQSNAFKQLQNIINSIWPKTEHQPILIGPDSGNKLNDANATEYEWIINFIKYGCSIVNGFTYHSYINQNKTNILTLNGMNTQYNWSVRFNKAVWNNCGNDTMIFAGEIAESYHGGINGLTNVYEDSLWYLDALGTLFKLGTNGFFRQQFYGNIYHPNYALLDGTNINNPYSSINPDYWIAYLFKILIGNKVFNAISNSLYFRVYANCFVNNNGSIVLYYINMKKEYVDLSWDKNVLGNNRMEYLISTDNAQLDTTDILLNGQQLVLDNNRKIPTINGRYLNGDIAKIDMYSVGFIHFTDVKSEVCMK